jgi:glycosyltransferase involved in cell wall biosynthesis
MSVKGAFMRVAMIGPFGLRPKGTMSVRALPLAKALAARGHRVTLLLPPWNWPDHDGQAWVEGGVTVENVSLPSRVPGLWHLLLAGRLVRRALALRPDAIHCFKPKAYAGLAAWILWRLKRLGVTRARLVVDADDWEGFGGWNDLESYSWAQKRFFAWQERWGLRHHDALTVASRTLESIVWSLGVPSHRVTYLPNGVPGSRLEGSEARRGDGNTVLLYTRFFEFGLERVARVFGRIHRARPDARFLIVGKGLFGEEDRFLALCRAAGMAGAIEYAGWIEPEALPGYFARVDVALYPFDDTLINRAKCAVKLLDLMAAGVPVAAEAVGQNAGTIQHGVSGLLVPPGDGDALVAAAIRLLDNAGLRRRLGQGAQRRIRECFTWERLAPHVERAYLEGGWHNSPQL